MAFQLSNTQKRSRKIGSGQEVCFCPSRPDPGRNALEQDGTRTGWDGPHLGTWMGPKHCKTKHMANLDRTTSDPGWDPDGPRIGPRRGSGWHPPRDSNRLLGLSEKSLCKLFVQTILFVRAARVQNEFAPEKFLNRYEKRFEKREKGSEKRSETRLKNV